MKNKINRTDPTSIAHQLKGSPASIIKRLDKRNRKFCSIWDKSILQKWSTGGNLFRTSIRL